MLDMIRKNRKNGRKRKIILIEDISMKTNKLTINIDPKLHTDFKVICSSTNQSIKDVIGQLIKEYVNQYIHNINQKG